MSNYQATAIMKDRNMHSILSVEANNAQEAEQVALNHLDLVGGYYADRENLVRIDVINLDEIARYG